MTGLVEETVQEAAGAAERAVRAASLPRRLALAAVALLVVAVALFVVMNSRIDWLGLTKKRADHAEVKAATSDDNAAARQAEADAQRQATVRLDNLARQQAKTTRDLAEAVAQARSAPDANQPLPDDRAARLRDADDRLCADARLSGCASPAADHAEAGH